VFFEAMITPRGDFTGALKIWMNNQVLFDLSSIKTNFRTLTKASLLGSRIIIMAMFLRQLRLSIMWTM